jgi:hypothetical protein
LASPALWHYDLRAMKYLLPLVVLTSSSVVFAQTKPASCDLTIKDSPAIRNIRLGMPEKDVKKIRLWLDSKKKKTRPRKVPDTSKFEGLVDGSFDFYNGRLYRFELFYDRSIRWKGPEEFADAITPALKLPSESWAFERGVEGRIHCKEFKVEINSSLNSLKLTDTIAEATIK